ncbi:hypothetical protein KP509_01G096600 [Ceratopteris richardii]|uniref:Uncharacterized protein n=1 Tax=Ceratopteris richardii TaxID=49495 RepID=A0A8T2VFE7_CERRI|nr:hypothetical protein KP509_01G096600 [Ceratopteris richardii]
MPFHLSSGRMDLSHIFEHVNGMQEKQYSVLGPFYRKSGVLEEGYSSFINPTIAHQIVFETSMKCMCSASLMTRKTLYHCTVSHNTHPMSSCAILKGQINKLNGTYNKKPAIA